MVRPDQPELQGLLAIPDQPALQEQQGPLDQKGQGQQATLEIQAPPVLPALQDLKLQAQRDQQVKPALLVLQVLQGLKSQVQLVKQDQQVLLDPQDL